MTMLKVFERLYDKDNKPILKRVPDSRGNTNLTSDYKTWYMDLSYEEEKQLSGTKRFGFESIPDFDVKDIAVKDKRAGINRKAEIFATLGPWKPLN